MPTARKNEAVTQDDPRALIRWTRRYAKSRTISFLVQWVFIVIMVTVVAAAGYFTNQAYREDPNGIPFYASVTTMFLAIIALAWFSLSGRGGDVIWAITRRIYGREGYVEYTDGSPGGPMPMWLTIASAGLIIYHLVGALLVTFNFLYMKNMMPFSAAYMVPFLFVIIITQRLGFWAYIWPSLYALHAILMLAGAPIRFSGQWQLMNMVVPVLGYGFVAILIGHLYSRFALLQLKRLARSGLDGMEAVDEEEEGP